MFHGREDLIDEIQKKLKEGSQHPIVVHGQSGCGKTSVVAKCASMVSDIIFSTMQLLKA